MVDGVAEREKSAIGVDVVGLLPPHEMRRSRRRRPKDTVSVLWQRYIPDLLTTQQGPVTVPLVSTIEGIPAPR